MPISVTGKASKKSSSNLIDKCVRAGESLRRFEKQRFEKQRFDKSAAGFTLLELLVVVLIIGIGMAIVGVSIGNNKPQELRNNARDFANFTALVEEEAVLSRESWGVQIYREGQSDTGNDKIAYRFLRLTDNGWLPDHPRDIPAGGEFADNVNAELEVEGAPQLIEPLPKELNDGNTSSEKMKSDKSAKKQSATTPTVWLAPGGDVTPFELRLHFSGDEKGPIVRSDALGRIQLEVKDDETK